MTAHPTQPVRPHGPREGTRPAATIYRFQRHECKYLLSEAQAGAVRRYVAPYVESDTYARRNDGRYRISSLYLDTRTLRLQRETIEGQRTRFKLRVRTYSDALCEPVYLEIKRRHNAIIDKTRSPLPRALLDTLMHGADVSAHVPAAHSDAHREFCGWMTQIHAQPILCVRYVREPYVGLFHPRARVTFDRQLQYNATRDLVLGGAGWNSVEPQRVILELKWNGKCPGWMERAVHRYGLQRISYSKYSNCVLAAQSSGALTMSAVCSVQT